ncbi:MAG TPA: LamG-like jellyroll fold domain-containing protein [Anaerolineae bacterium]|nr:LamG-like jellyroll fold domain-containing protein [Anaerolineae bacterium]
MNPKTYPFIRLLSALFVAGSLLAGLGWWVTTAVATNAVTPNALPTTNSTPSSTPISLMSNATTIGETGQVALLNTIDGGHTAIITFSQPYNDPVVVAFINTRNQNAAVDVRVRNVTSVNFELFMEKQGNAVHNPEVVSYIIMEKGHFLLDNGLEVKAGSIDTNSTHVNGALYSGVPITFSQPFDVTPVVLHTLNSYNKTNFMSSIAYNVTPKGFRLQQQSPAVGGYIETIGWIAFSPGEGTMNGYDYEINSASDGTADGVIDSPHIIPFSRFNGSPHVVVKANSGFGTNSYWARGAGTYQLNQQTVFAELSTLTSHPDEIFGWAAFDPGTTFTSVTPNCFVETTGDNQYDYISLDSSALQDAAGGAADGDLLKIAGTCAGTQIRELGLQTVVITKNLTLQGGYTNTNWLAAPDPATYPTVLDAQKDGRVVRIISSTVTLENLTITGGDTSFDVAGIYDHISYDGAGILIEGDNPIVTATHITVIDNTAISLGGGLYLDTGSLLLLNSNIISNSAGSDGGGIFNLSDNIIISNTIIQDNYSSANGGGLLHTRGTLHIANSTIANNTADNSGGGLALGVYFTTTKTTISNSIIQGNQAINNDGGGIWNRSAIMTLTHSTIADNHASVFGGGLYHGGQLHISNSTFHNNRVVNWIYHGGAIWAEANFPVTIDYTTIYSNYSGGLNVGSGDHLTITASIIANSNYGFDCAGNVNDGGYNLIRDGNCISASTSFSGNPKLHPLAESNGSLPVQRPQTGSPVLDHIPTGMAGCGPTVQTDQRGASRPFGNGCDIGAVESVYPVATADTYQTDRNVPLVVPHLVGHWRLDEGSGTTIADNSRHNNQGFLINNPTWQTNTPDIYKSTHALQFNPTASTFVDIPADPSLDLSHGRFTLAAWIYPTPTDNNYYGFLGHQPTASENRRYPSLYIRDQNRIHAGFGDGVTWHSITTGPVLTTHAWNHVAATFNGTTYTIYVNGQPVLTDNTTFAGHTPYPTTRVGIGRVNNYFNGLMDDVRIYNTALSATDIAHVADWGQAGLTLNDNALIGWGPVATTTIQTPPLSGTISLQPDGAFVYTPTWDFTGTDSFTYRLERDGIVTTAVVTIDIPHCYVQNSNSLTIYRSFDHTALNAALDAANAGTTLKVSGLCAGDSSDVLTDINRNVQMEGGYTPQNWFAPPDVTANPTIIAANGGRVIQINPNTVVTLRGLTITGGFGWNGAGIHIAASAVVTVENSLIWQNNSGNGFGGGIHNQGDFWLLNSTIQENEGYIGAGFYNNGGTTIIRNSQILTNTATDSFESSGGGLANAAGNVTIYDSLIAGNVTTAYFFSYGGGLVGSGNSQTTLYNTLIQKNTAMNGGGLHSDNGQIFIYQSTISQNNGGGIDIQGGHLALTNSTISGNSGGGDGSGIRNDGTLTLTHTTVAGNYGATANIYNDDNSHLTIGQSIIAGNNPADCLTGTSITIQDNGFNLIQDNVNSCGLSHGVNNNIVGQAPLLAGLGDNGGTTPTMALSPYSPALNVIPAGNCPVAIDQRGITRPQFTTCDIGAYEYDVMLVLADTYSLTTPTPLTVATPGVLANDMSLDGNALTAVLTTHPQNGTLTFNSDGSFLFTPPASPTSVTTFTYQAVSPAIIAHWSFDDGTNPTANTINQQHEGVLTNGADFTTTVPLTITTPNVNALQLDGINQYVTIDDHPDLNFAHDEDFTVALWVKADPIQNDTAFIDNEIVIKWSTSGGYPFALRYLNQTSDPALRGRIRAGRYDGTNFSYIDSSIRIDDGHYHHVAFTKLGPDLSLYIDGILAGTTTDTTTGNTENSSPLYLGRRGSGSNHFGGEIDDLHLFRQSLSPAEVGALAAGEFAYTVGETAVVTITVNPAVLAPNLTITAIADTTATLGWDTNPVNCAYAIYKSDNPYTGYTLLVDELTTDTYADNGAIGNPAQNYFYYVQATGCGAGAATAVSNRIGAFDFAITPGN